MAKEFNPFIVTGKIDPEYFCDRVNESARLIKSLVNGNNMVIISPRRMGKTGLIRFCYEKPVIKEDYYTSDVWLKKSLELGFDDTLVSPKIIDQGIQELKQK